MLVALLISMSAFATSPSRPTPEPVPTPIPVEAQKILDAYEKAGSDARVAYEKATISSREKAIRDLEVLQDRYTKAGKLDDAIGVRERVRELKGVLIGSSWKAPANADVGRMFEVAVTGATVGGTVWGTGPYTSDSDPNVAAVHAGFVKPGESAQLTIEVMPGLPSYEGSMRNGVTTQKYGAWSPSYRFAKRPE